MIVFACYCHSYSDFSYIEVVVLVIIVTIGGIIIIIVIIIVITIIIIIISSSSSSSSSTTTIKRIPTNMIILNIMFIFIHIRSCVRKQEGCIHTHMIVYSLNDIGILNMLQGIFLN